MRRSDPVFKSNPTVVYDARFLQPKTRHWGVGAVIGNVIGRLNDQFQFVGLAPKFRDLDSYDIRFWPRIPRVNRLMFEASPLLAGKFDAYWSTAHLLPGILNRPSVMTVHDMLFLNNLERRWFSGLLARSFRSALARATKIVAVSRTTADDLIAEFPELQKKMEVALNGYDSPGPEVVDALIGPRLPVSPYMMMLGCHAPRKNLSLALSTICQLRDGGTDAQLLITGDVHPSFEAMLSPTPSGVELAGVLEKPAIFRLLKGAVCLLFPSRYEGFGLPILEAMAVGCPVLALDTPINREIAGDAACLLPDDPIEWAKACKRLINARSAREEISGRGFQNLARFSWAKTAAAYGQIFTAVAR